MEITAAQPAQIGHCLPRQRGNVGLSNLQVLNAILYVAEHGCQRRGPSRRLCNRHTIYTRMSRSAKVGVLDKAFEQLKRAQVAQIKTEAVSPGSTSVKVHADGTGARKQTVRRPEGCRRVFSRFETPDIMFVAFVGFALVADGPRLG